MKAFRLIALAVVVTSGLLLSTLPVSAQSSTLTQEQRDRIQANCLTIKNTLTQLRASDALLRVNRGQVYEAMSNRLMERLNNRLSSNSLDARGVVSLTKSYNDRLTQFRTHYEDYARQLEATLRIDCSQDPDAFHLAVANARSKRTVIHDDVIKLHGLIDDYRSSVSDFQRNFQRVSGSSS